MLVSSKVMVFKGISEGNLTWRPCCHIVVVMGDSRGGGVSIVVVAAGIRERRRKVEG